MVDLFALGARVKPRAMGRPPRSAEAAEPRTCSVCQEPQPLTAFHVKSVTALGFKSYSGRCIKCVATGRRGQRQECLAAARARDRARYHATRKHDPARREQSRLNARRLRAANPARFLEAGWRAQGIRGFTYQDFLRLQAEQAGRCAICRRPSDQLHVDHAHDSGQVRGLLCGGCNRALGLLGDDPARLLAAVAYLQIGARTVAA